MWVSDWRGSGPPTAIPIDIDAKPRCRVHRLPDPRRGATELAAVRPERRPETPARGTSSSLVTSRGTLAAWLNCSLLEREETLSEQVLPGEVGRRPLDDLILHLGDPCPAT
jgi:hypothetical protein